MDGKRSLLYLDDEEINLMLFKEMFKKDFEVHTVSSATEALEFLRENPVEVILTDQRMPVMSGVEFLEEFSKMAPEKPPKRVMVSGYSPEGEINEAIDKKILDQFVSKPWTYKQLKEVLSS
jgi:CheY-like chemotaxis protein